MAEDTKANVFSLEASISINTDNFEKKITKIKESGLILQQTMEKGIKSVKALQQFLNGFDTTKFKQGVKGIGDGFDGLGDKAKDSKEKIGGIGNSAEDSAEKSQTAFDKLKDSVNATFDEMDDHFKMTSGSLQSSISATATNFGKITAAVEKVINAIKKIGEVAVKSFKIAVEAGEKFTESIVDVVEKANDIENKLSLVFGGAGLATGAASFAVGKDFESSMANVIAIMGVTKDTVDEEGQNIYDMLSNAAKEAGASTMFTAKESADALGYLAQMGYKAENAIATLPTVLAVAKAGGMDLAYTAKQLAISMNVLGKDGGYSVEYLGDVLTTAANNSGTSIQELMEAFTVVGGQANAAQVPLEDTVKLLSVLANAGYTGSQGGTLARNIIKNLYTPTEKAQQYMDSLGLSRTYEDGKTLKSIQDFVDDMTEVMGGLENSEQLDLFSELFDVRNISGAYALLSDTETWGKLTEAIDECAGATERMGETYSDTVMGDMVSMTSRLQSVGLAIYEYIKNPIRDAVQEATGYLTELQQAIDGYGITAGAAKIGNIVDESLEKNTPSILEYMDEGKNIVLRFVNGFKDNIPQITDNINKIIEKFGEVRDDIFNALAFNLSENSESFVGVGATILTTMLATAENVTGTLAEYAPDFIEKIANSLTENKDEWQKAITAIIQNISTLIVNSAPALVEIGGTLLLAIVQGMETTTTEITKILPQILDEFTKLLSDKEFSESLQLAFKQIIGDLGDITVMLVKFMAEPDNLSFVTELIGNILNEITNTLDEITPEIMVALEQIGKKIGKFFSEELLPFIVTIKGIGISIGSAFAKGIWSGMWEGLSNVFPILKMFGINNDKAGELWLPEDINENEINVKTPNMPIADIVNQIPYGENVSQEEINKLLEQYRDANDMSSLYTDNSYSDIFKQNSDIDFDYSDTFKRNSGLAIDTSAANLVSNMDFSWASDIGYNLVTNIVNGISTAWEELKTKVSEVFSFLDFSDEIENAKKWGGNFIINFASKIIEKFDNWKASVANVFSFFDLSQKAENSKEHGGNFMVNFASSIINKWSAWSGSVLAIFDLFDLSHLSESAKKWGSDMIQNFADGINASYGVLETAVTAAATIVQKIWGHSTPDEGPLKDDNVWGVHLMQNLIDGINSKANALKSAVFHTADYIANGFEDTEISREISVNHQFAENFSPLISRIGDTGQYVPENVSDIQKNTSRNVTIQNLNINMEGMNVQSDYDVDRMSDRMIEKLSERLRMLNISDERGIGGTAW